LNRLRFRFQFRLKTKRYILKNWVRFGCLVVFVVTSITVFGIAKVTEESTIHTVGIISRETDFRNIVSPDGNDFGYMQINRQNHARLLKIVRGIDVMDGKTNVMMGTQMLYEIRDYWRRRGLIGIELERTMISSYHKGITGHIRTGEARAYVDEVTKFKEELSSGHQGQVFQSKM
jgi:hypothetical protein